MREGIDPYIEALQQEIAELREALVEKTKAPPEELTVKQLYRKVYAEHWNTARYVKSGWAYQVETIYKTHIKRVFGREKLSTVTRLRVKNWHRKYLDSNPTAGNRALAVLSKMFMFAEEQELRPQNTNPCTFVKSHEEKSRTRYATNEEIKKIDVILQREAAKRPKAVAFLYLLMYTGARPSAIARATWNQLKVLDVNGETIGLLDYAGKGDDEQLILPPQVMKIIESLPKKGEKIVGINMPTDLWAKVRREAGCEDLWARDLRRTFATVGLSTGVPIGQIGKVLNHKQTQTTEIYAKLIDSKKISTALHIATEVEKLAKG